MSSDAPSDGAPLQASHEGYSSSSMLIAYLSVFIDMLGMTIVIPIIPFLAIEFGASAAELGLIYASYSGAQMVSVPVSGWLSDKYGRKPLIMASLMGSFFGFLVQGLATDIGTFCAGRVITGAFGGSVPIVNAYIVDLIPPPQRPKYFARLGSCVIVAFMFGPGIGAGLAQFTLRTPMFVSCGIAGFGFILALFAFKEPVKRRARSDSNKTSVLVDADSKATDQDSSTAQTLDGKGTSKHGASENPSTPKGSPKPEYKALIRLVYVAAFLSMVTFSAYIYFFALLVYDLYGWRSLEFGFSAMAVSVWSIFNQLSTFVFFQKKFGKHAALIVGSVLVGIGMELVAALGTNIKAPDGLFLMSMALLTMGLGMSFMTPALTAVASRYASHEQQGAILGNAAALKSLGQTVGPLLWGVVYQSNRSYVFVFAGVSSFVMASIALAMYLLNKRLPEHRDERPVMDGVQRDGDAKLESVEMAALEEGKDDAAIAEIRSLRTENRVLRSKLSQYESNDIVNPDMTEALETAAKQHEVPGV